MRNPSISFGAATRLDWSAFDLATGIRAAAFAITPLAIGLASGHLQLLIATLGAFFIVQTEGPHAAPLQLRLLPVASLTEAVALGLGTLVGTLGFAAIPLVGIGVFVPLAFGSEVKWTRVTMFTAVVFAVGVGLPGASVSASGERTVFFLLGAFWGLFGAWAHAALRNRHRHAMAVPTPGAPQVSSSGLVPRVSSLHSEGFTHALALGLASSLGLAIGLALGLPRDFWIIVTLIVTSRPNFGLTVSSTSLMVAGTVFGAVIAAIITIGISDFDVLAVLLFVFYALGFASRGVNLGLVQVFFAPAVIILLNMLYPGQWELAGVRVLDVAIGGSLAILTAYFLGIASAAKDPGKKS